MVFHDDFLGCLGIYELMLQAKEVITNCIHTHSGANCYLFSRCVDHEERRLYISRALEREHR